MMISMNTEIFQCIYAARKVAMSSCSPQQDRWKQYNALSMSSRLTLVDLCPEAVLEDLFRVLQALGISEAIQMSQHTHDLREPM